MSKRQIIGSVKKREKNKTKAKAKKGGKYCATRWFSDYPRAYKLKPWETASSQGIMDKEGYCQSCDYCYHNYNHQPVCWGNLRLRKSCRFPDIRSETSTSLDVISGPCQLLQPCPDREYYPEESYFGNLERLWNLVTKSVEIPTFAHFLNKVPSDQLWLKSL